VARPDDPTVLRAVGRLAATQGAAPRAIGLLRKAVAQDPDDVRSQMTLAMALEKAGDPAAALETHGRLLAARPELVANRALMAETLFRQGRKDEAVALVREGLSAAGNSPRLHLNLASLLERSGRIAEAAAEYREYARLTPDSADSKAMEERAARLEERAKAPSAS
jgi:Flp pilus assembly protein TadD